ncbi:hypothetical protein D3C78_1302170 [compost metagenome]
MGEIDELLPQPRIFLGGVRRPSPRIAAPFHSWRPVIRRLPIRLREICGDRKPLAAESVKHMLANVGIAMCMKRRFGASNSVIRRMCVPHAISVVMLGRENQIFETAFGSDFRP